MNFQNINSQQYTDQMPKLTSIFSILFVSMFIITIILTDDKWGLNEKSIPRPQLPTSESSSTIGDDFESKDLIIPSHKYLDESKITKQSGTSSFISNYINAWKLSKANSAMQMIV
jgi:hypothetical protein